MKGVRKIHVMGLVLSAVLLAGVATAQGGGIQFSKNGDIVTITGHTNLAAGDRLLINVVSAGFTPTEKGSGGGFTGAAWTVVVQQGSPLNMYGFDVNVSTFPPGKYLVSVESLETGFRDSAQFVLPWTPLPTPALTTPIPSSAAPSTTSAPAITMVPSTGGTPAPVPLMGITSPGAILLALCFLRVRGSSHG